MSAGTQQQQTTFERLKERIPDSLIRGMSKGGASIRFIDWHTAADLLDERAPGWECEIKEVGSIGGKVFMRVAITIEGITRSNVGYEDEDQDGYGDPFSNSFAMAFKRTAALFGLARHLYDKSDRSRRPEPTRQQPPQRPQSAPVATSKPLATKTQINQLLEYEAALEEYDVKPSTLRDKLEEKYHTREPNRLTESEASDYIDWLKARLGKKREAV